MSDKRLAANRFLAFFREYTVLFVLILLCLAFYLGNPAFINPSNIITILRQVSMLGVGSIGVMFIMISGGINLAMGSIVSIVSVVIALFSVNFGLHWGLAMALALLGSLIVGYVMGVVIIRTNINSMVGTLAFKIILTGVAFIICGGLPIYGIAQESKIFGQGYIWEIPIPIIIFAVVAVVAAFILNKTYVGRYFFVIGSNEEAARLSGINTKRIKTMAYAICGLLGGIAGVVMYGRVGSGQPNCGTEIEMNVISAIVIGGVSMSGGEGKVLKACCGVLLIGVINNGLTMMNVNEYTKMVVLGTIFLLAVVLDSYQQRAKKVKVQESAEHAASESA